MNGILNPGDLPEGELILSRSDFANNPDGRLAFNGILKLWNIHPRNFPHIQKVRVTFVRRAIEAWNNNGTKILI